MNIQSVKKQIIGDLELLKDKKGFLRANSTNFNRLFGRDSLIAAWQLLDWNPSICKATLEILSGLQGKIVNDEREEEPGKIIHETDLRENWHPEGYFPFPYYGSADSTPLYLSVFSFYIKKTKDFGFLNAHWQNILRALRWMEEYGDKDKDLFIEYERKNPQGLFHQGWKDSFDNHLQIDPPVALVEVQGYRYLALKETAKLAEIKKDKRLSENLAQKAALLKTEFNKKFWVPEEKYFALGLDAQKQPRKSIASNPGLLLFTGIIENNKINDVAARLFKEDLWTPYGIRTHSVLEPDFNPFHYHLGTIWPHDNWMIAQGLEKIGKQKEYDQIKEALLKALCNIGYRYMPEYYAVTNHHHLFWSASAGNPQAWTIGSLFNFLGITPTLKEKVLRLRYADFFNIF